MLIGEVNRVGEIVWVERVGDRVGLVGRVDVVEGRVGREGW